jgi:hypothetical protein
MRQHSGGIQVSAGGGRGRIGKIISQYIDSLHICNGSLSGGSNTFLKTTHISSKSWLVTDSRRNATKKGRHLRTGLGEMEDVIIEKKHILSLLVTEVFGNGQTGKGGTGTHPRGLVYPLAIHQQGSLRSSGGSSSCIDLDDTSLYHRLMVQIVPSFVVDFVASREAIRCKPLV